MKTLKFLIGITTLLVIFFISCVSNTDQQSIPSTESKEVKEILIEEIVKASNDFNKTYILKKEEDISYSGINRRQARIVLPSELSKENVTNNIKLATIEIYNKYTPDGISILAFEEGDNIESGYTVGMGEFAPFGQWGKIEKNVPLVNFELKIDLREAYFEPKEKVLKEGADIILFKEKKYDQVLNKSVPATSVPLSKLMESWREEDVLVRVPNNSRAQIIKVHTQKWPNGKLLVRYKVSVTYSGKQYIGWVDREDAK